MNHIHITKKGWIDCLTILLLIRWAHDPHWIELRLTPSFTLTEPLPQQRASIIFFLGTAKRRDLQNSFPLIGMCRFFPSSLPATPHRSPSFKIWIRHCLSTPREVTKMGPEQSHRRTHPTTKLSQVGSYHQNISLLRKVTSQDVDCEVYKFLAPVLNPFVPAARNTLKAVLSSFIFDRQRTKFIYPENLQIKSIALCSCREKSDSSCQLEDK